MGMIMKYPSIDSFSESGIRDINPGNMLEVIGSCILQIYEKKGEKVYDTKDQTQKELVEFIEQLNSKPTVREIARSFDMDDFEEMLKNAQEANDRDTIRRLLKERNEFVHNVNDNN
jgi:uncharacterized protein YjgD (DUF1641 family)